MGDTRRFYFLKKTGLRPVPITEMGEYKIKVDLWIDDKGGGTVVRIPKKYANFLLNNKNLENKFDFHFKYMGWYEILEQVFMHMNWYLFVKG